MYIILIESNFIKFLYVINLTFEALTAESKTLKGKFIKYYIKNKMYLKTKKIIFNG